MPYTTPQEAIQCKEVKDRIAKEVQRYNEFFGETEQIKRYTLIADEWTTGNGILTPTLKVRRKIVNDKYQDQIQSMYR